MTVVECNPNDPFLIATKSWSRRGHFFSLDCFTYSWSVPYNAEGKAKKNQVWFFLVLGIARPGIEPQSPGPMVNTLIIIENDWYKFSD